ncbi:MAG: serine/threonine protein kinase [Crocosphaera sp.]|uniref:serine/threonine protein kinase n=1 Tax=Crocosphaera sp. TaxID=2729996 RepID=UPI002585C4B6|nr:serine/threonine-protein kinase [Crocosphaera sp.]MCH2245666.1 serine/threonine protein kinase [Crocosphaera sp.]
MPKDSTYKLYEETQFNPKYRLLKYLGSGAFGAVFRADGILRDTPMGTVALKVIRGDRTDLNAMIQELQLATSFNHPHIIRCQSWEEGILFNPSVPMVDSIDCLGLVMEEADITLAEYLRQASLSRTEIQTILEQMSSALVYLHGSDRAIVHQDLKPDNIMKIGEVWKLADFGASRALLHSSTITNNATGTPEYAAPEALQFGQISPAWDCWSLGVILVELLTGERPFQGNSQALRNSILNHEPIGVESLPEPFREIALGCLQKDLKQRWSAEVISEKLLPQKNISSILPQLSIPNFSSSSLIKNTDTKKQSKSQSSVQLISSPVQLMDEHEIDFWIGEIERDKTIYTAPFSQGKMPHYCSTDLTVREYQSLLETLLLTLNSQKKYIQTSDASDLIDFHVAYEKITQFSLNVEILEELNKIIDNFIKRYNSLWGRFGKESQFHFLSRKLSIGEFLALEGKNIEKRINFLYSQDHRLNQQQICTIEEYLGDEQTLPIIYAIMQRCYLENGAGDKNFGFIAWYLKGDVNIQSVIKMEKMIIEYVPEIHQLYLRAFKEAAQTRGFSIDDYQGSYRDDPIIKKRLAEYMIKKFE